MGSLFLYQIQLSADKNKIHLKIQIEIQSTTASYPIFLQRHDQPSLSLNILISGFICNFKVSYNTNQSHQNTGSLYSSASVHFLSLDTSHLSLPCNYPITSLHLEYICRYTRLFYYSIR